MQRGDLSFKLALNQMITNISTILSHSPWQVEAIGKQSSIALDLAFYSPAYFPITVFRHAFSLNEPEWGDYGLGTSKERTELEQDILIEYRLQTAILG